MHAHVDAELTDPADPAAGPVNPAAACATIDLDAIAHNVRTLRVAAADADVMAVVKADGYGHGAVPVAQAAIAAGARELGVATVDEAVRLRAAGITAPLTCWLHSPTTSFTAAVTAGVTVAVSSPEQLRSVIATADALGTAAAVALKVDTGLNRGGIDRHRWREAAELAAKAVAAEAISVRSIFSHLISGEEPANPRNDEQATRLRAAAADLRALGLAEVQVHLANSAATLTRPDLAFDLVRPGISVYGGHAVDRELWAADLPPLRPAMTLAAQVALVKRVDAGDGVSYGHQWTAPHDTTVALLPIGYADGLFRGLSGKLSVAINGRRYAGVGRICMDQFLVDIGLDHDVTEGDWAYVFGPGDHGEPTAGEVAAQVDTIDYELFSAIRGRCVRRYLPVRS